MTLAQWQRDEIERRAHSAVPEHQSGREPSCDHEYDEGACCGGVPWKRCIWCDEEAEHCPNHKTTAPPEEDR